ncbi:MAG: hypothetical protein Q9N67_07155 [Ghiorsea sp.]|nr:hypothetical protein [Ghiorsea sp.]
MTKTKKTIVIVAAVCGISYFSLMLPAANGYGYVGHGGYSSGPSFFYWGGGGTTIYRDREVRRGSVNGSGVRGGGPGSGK